MTEHGKVLRVSASQCVLYINNYRKAPLTNDGLRVGEIEGDSVGLRVGEIEGDSVGD